MPYLTLLGQYHFLAVIGSQNLSFCPYVVYPRIMCYWPSLKAERSFASILLIALKRAENLIPSWSFFCCLVLITLGLTFSFFMISPTDQQVHCWAWLKKYMPKDSNLLLEDVTWKYTGKVALWGQLCKKRPANPDSSPFTFMIFDIQKWVSELEVWRGSLVIENWSLILPTCS